MISTMRAKGNFPLKLQRVSRRHASIPTACSPSPCRGLSRNFRFKLCACTPIAFLFQAQIAMASLGAIAVRLGGSDNSSCLFSAAIRAADNQIFFVLDLPAPIDPDKVNATLSDGVLEVKLLKTEAGKKITVRTKAASA